MTVRTVYICIIIPPTHDITTALSFIIKEGRYSEATLLRSFLLFCRITQHLRFHVAADQNERKQAGHVSHDARGFPSKSEHVNVSKSLLLTFKLPQCVFPYDVSRALSQQKKNKEPLLSRGTCLWFLIYSALKRFFISMRPWCIDSECGRWKFTAMVWRLQKKKTYFI